MTVDSAVPPDVILSTLQKHIENASFKYQHAPNPSEIAFTLPADANTTSKFPEMFSELSKDRNVLGIETIGLSPTTMDEVFTKQVIMIKITMWLKRCESSLFCSASESGS